MSTEARRALVRAGTHALRFLLIAAIAVTLFVAYGLVNNAWYHVLVVRGGSMEPAISAGDLIVITRPPERIEVGQVLTLQVDGSIVTHRVVEVRPDGTFVTQGDANEARDDFSGNELHVVGEYRFSLPLLGAIIEPIVSGAWFGDGGGAELMVGSGSWETVTALRPAAGGGIVWSAPEGTPVPTPQTPSLAPAPGTPSPAIAPSMTPVPSGDPRDRPTPASRSMPSREPSPMPSTDEVPPASPTAEACASPSPSPSEATEPSPTGEPCASPSPSPSEATEPSPTAEATMSDAGSASPSGAP